MSKNRIRFYITLAIIFAVFTAIAFLLPCRRDTVFWLSYIFGAAALAVQLYAYSTAFGGESPRSKFYGFPIAKLSTIYLAAQLALSLLFMLLSLVTPIPAWLPALLFVLLLAGALLGLIAADAAKEEIERQDTVHRAHVDTMHALQSKAAYIASQCDDAETKKALGKLADSFRYSDPVSSDALTDAEAGLNALVDELQSAVMEKDHAAARTLCAKVESALAERNRLCRLNK